MLDIKIYYIKRYLYIYFGIELMSYNDERT